MNKAKIVIVDDSPFSISILRDILIDKGYEVVGEAGSLAETKKVVMEKKPDLVTMDMTIPGTNGLECTRAIHEIDENIKVIVVSSMMDDEIVKKAKNANVAGYVQKPVDPEELITNIERVMASEELFKQLEESYFDVFKESLSDNLNRLAKVVPNYQQSFKSNDTEHSRGISAVIGVIGKYSGRLIIDLSYETANNMVHAVLKRDSKSIEETLAMVGEFSNIVSGNASSLLNRKNKLYGFRVAPPTIFHGSSLNISKTMMDTVSIIANTEFGEIYLNVGFQRGEGEWM